jgi:hypothetical protein
MNDASRYACTICGEQNPDPNQWFLLTENQWEDKLKILEWNSLLACQQGIHLACSPTHVQELVVHWMATGSVNHPFARTASWEVSTHRWNALSGDAIDTDGVRTLGEITVHRESMHRVLSEHPGSLKSILDALHGALQPDSSGASGTGLTLRAVAQGY